MAGEASDGDRGESSPTLPTRWSGPAVEPIPVACIESAASSDVPALLAADDGIDVDVVPSETALLERLDAVECVVSVTDDPDDRRSFDLLAEIRATAEALPFLLASPAPTRDVLDDLFAVGSVDVVSTDGPGPGPRLTRRIRTLVGHDRASALARHATAALEAARDGIAVVAGDGSIALANRQFARRFGYEPGDLLATPWRELFADETADRLERDGLAAVADGWEWIGNGEGRRADGRTVALQTRLAGVIDDGFVLAISRNPQTAGD